MKQTLIQIIVAAAALAALAAIVYRAQSNAPAPDAITQPTDEPEFLPSTKTDAGAGAKVREIGTINKPNAPEQAPDAVPSDNTADPTEADEAAQTPTLKLNEEPMFLPTTKAPFLPPHIPEQNSEDE